MASVLSVPHLRAAHDDSGRFIQIPFQIQTMRCCGGTLNPEIIEKWKKGTGIVIRDGYGQTEALAFLPICPVLK